MAEVYTNPMLPEFLPVTRFRRETRDTFTIELKPNGRGGRFSAGQFNMLYVFGKGEVPISISGSPEDPRKLIHTVRAVGPVTKALRAVKAGDMIGVRGPFGTPWPVDRAKGKDVVLVAGGIGLAPLRSVVYQVLHRRNEFGKVYVLYGTRSPDDILYRRELERWRSRFDLEVSITVDRATGSWRGNVGVVTTLIAKAPFDPQKTIAMVCGPEVMMRFTVQELARRGVDMKEVFISMERNMKCGIGVCGHCQHGPFFICKDGPVISYDRIKNLLAVREI